MARRKSATAVAPPSHVVIDASAPNVVFARLVDSPTAPKVAAIVTSPEAPTVAARKRARRAAELPAADPPKPTKPVIDLAQPNAAKILSATFPRPTSETMRAATEEEARAALAYLEGRDAEARAKGAKEAAGNVLKYAIGEDLGLHGDGWKATWGLARGSVDWARVLKALVAPPFNIPQHVLDHLCEEHRGEASRRIDVRETADE